MDSEVWSCQNPSRLSPAASLPNRAPHTVGMLCSISLTLKRIILSCKWRGEGGGEPQFLCKSGCWAVRCEYLLDACSTSRSHETAVPGQPNNLFRSPKTAWITEVPVTFCPLLHPWVSAGLICAAAQHYASCWDTSITPHYPRLTGSDSFSSLCQSRIELMLKPSFARRTASLV